MATKRGRPKQGHLPGMKPPSIKELDSLADDYTEVRDERMRLTETEIDKRDLLQAMMKKHNLHRYEYDGKVIEVVADEKVKVSKKKESLVEAGKRHLSNGKADE